MLSPLPSFALVAIVWGRVFLWVAASRDVIWGYLRSSFPPHGIRSLSRASPTAGTLIVLLPPARSELLLRRDRQRKPRC
jgi:hypothetical protein